MCTTSGCDCGTADVIFTRKCQYDIQCIEFGVDNTSVNIRVHKSIMNRVKANNESCYFMGYIVHNIACKGSNAYRFDKSTKRKCVLQEFCTTFH